MFTPYTVENGPRAGVLEAVPDFLLTPFGGEESGAFHLVEVSGDEGLGQAESGLEGVNGLGSARLEDLDDFEAVSMGENLERLGHAVQKLDGQFDRLVFHDHEVIKLS